MHTLPLWLDFLIYIMMIATSIAIGKYLFDLVKIIRSK
jgi:hypothetical protein